MLLNDKQASLMNSVGEGSPTQSLTWLRSCLFWISQAMGCVAFSWDLFSLHMNQP